MWKHFARHESVEQEASEAVATEGNWFIRHTIGRLGFKLLLSIPRHFLDDSHPLHVVLSSKGFDLGSSVLTLLVFLVPIATHLLRKRLKTDKVKPTSRG